MNNNSMNHGLSAAITVALLSPAVFAAPPSGAKNDNHLLITEAFIDVDNALLIVHGQGFDTGRSLNVVLGEIGDITGSCMEDLWSTPQAITCDFSADGLPGDGDYLLRVSTGGGASQYDEYDLTLGAVGPQGPQGPQGEQGPVAQPLVYSGGTANDGFLRARYFDLRNDLCDDAEGCRITLHHEYGNSIATYGPLFFKLSADATQWWAHPLNGSTSSSVLQGLNGNVFPETIVGTDTGSNYCYFSDWDTSTSNPNGGRDQNLNFGIIFRNTTGISQTCSIRIED